MPVSRAVNRRIKIKLEKAWPSIVAEVQLTHSAGNEITRLPVTFQYKRWRILVK